MFPPSNATIYHNEAGEVVGWSIEDDAPAWCDWCGSTHSGPCFDDLADDDEDDA